MKKFMFLIAALMVMAGASTAFAESHGSILIPAVQYHYKTSKANLKYTLSLSNITDEEIECTVRFFDSDGNDNGALVKIYKGSNDAYSTGAYTSGNTFTIPAHGTRLVGISSGPQQCFVIGHAILEWKSNNDRIGKALIGGIRYLQRSGTSYSYGISHGYLNNGQPF